MIFIAYYRTVCFPVCQCGLLPFSFCSLSLYDMCCPLRHLITFVVHYLHEHFAYTAKLWQSTITPKIFICITLHAWIIRKQHGTQCVTITLYVLIRICKTYIFSFGQLLYWHLILHLFTYIMVYRYWWSQSALKRNVLKTCITVCMMILVRCVHLHVYVQYE